MHICISNLQILAIPSAILCVYVVTEEINMTKAERFWNKMARKYSRDAIKDMASYEYTLERTRSYLKPAHRVLELGAGTSSTAMLLAGGVAHYTATDISSEMVAIGQEKLDKTPIPSLEIEVGDAGGFAQGSNQFDVVIGLNLFHLVDDPDAVFSQVHGMLPKGGLFISKTACLADWPNVFMRLFVRIMVGVMTMIKFAPKPIHFFKIKTLELMIENAGFEIIESGNHPVSPPSRYVVARKT
jgi:ubiquinone/menaquinone biosynthesis C-methylase UbiE